MAVTLDDFQHEALLEEYVYLMVIKRLTIALLNEMPDDPDSVAMNELKRALTEYRAFQ